MKTGNDIPSLFFFGPFFLVLLLGALAHGQTIESITVTPATPTPDDKIRIDINGTVTNACYREDIITTSGLDACGVSLIFQATWKSGCMPFPNEPWGWEKTARLDNPLPAGNYIILAELYEDGELKDSMTTSFFVIGYAEITDVQIIRVRSSLLSNLHLGDTLTLMIDAVGPEGTELEYRFFSRYGESGWANNPWILEQDWRQSNSVEYEFTAAGPYYVIGHVRAKGGSAWGPGDPQGGFVVDVKE